MFECLQSSLNVRDGVVHLLPEGGAHAAGRERWSWKVATIQHRYCYCAAVTWKYNLSQLECPPTRSKSCTCNVMLLWWSAYFFMRWLYTKSGMMVMVTVGGLWENTSPTALSLSPITFWPLTSVRWWSSNTPFLKGGCTCKACNFCIQKYTKFKGKHTHTHT